MDGNGPYAAANESRRVDIIDTFTVIEIYDEKLNRGYYARKFIP